MKPYLMVVDDAADQLQLMSSVFKMVDPTVQVILVNGGDEALKYLRAEPTRRPKVILLDLRMPGKNGQEVLTELKSDPSLKRIPVCIFSNADLEHEICDCYDRGASFYFKKPSGLDELKTFMEHFKGLYFKFASFCPR